MLTICLLALIDGALLGSFTLPEPSGTLAWTHSIEKQRWEEDYQVSMTPQGPRLLLTEARIKGSGAGMEPPEHATFSEGWYRYQPQQRHWPELRLLTNAYAAPYEWCAAGKCQPLTDWGQQLNPSEWKLLPCFVHQR